MSGVGRPSRRIARTRERTPLAHYRTTLDTPASAQSAFEYLANFANAERWDPSVTRGNRLTELPIGLGSRFEIFLGLPVGETRLEYRITRFEPDHCVVLEARTALVRSLDTIEIEPRPTGCRVHYDADLRPQGTAYLLDLPLHLGFQVAGARSVRGLEKALVRLR